MKKQISQARAEYSDLERLGWDFDDIYESVADAQDVTREEAEEWEKENYHVILDVEDGEVYWQPCHNTEGRTGDRQRASYSPSDNAESLRHIKALHDSGDLWEVFYEEEEEEEA